MSGVFAAHCNFLLFQVETVKVKINTIILHLNLRIALVCLTAEKRLIIGNCCINLIFFFPLVKKH